MKIDFFNDWKDVMMPNLFSISWQTQRSFVFKLLGFTYYPKEKDNYDQDSHDFFYHLVDGHFMGKGDEMIPKEEYMFGIDILGFGILISFEE